MGKKAKKTRWRALTLNGHQSDSEESSSKSNLQTPNGYENKFSKFTYSSQSTPIRKFQTESNKTTRSNSTTSEHKTTFNEDEYTRITTPRQDVLFKKGYLNKPKNYQTQTSTGTSTTANSTSTCTPDHQSADGTESTDLEYESPFMFPNGFIDQNGIYYVNSFEPFPFVVYNAPLCYPEYPSSRCKRYSTDSMTESVSPQNEEVNYEQTDDGSNKTPVFNQSYVQQNGYYCNGVSTATNSHSSIEETRRVKKKRRKLSRSKSDHDEDASSEESDNCDSPTLVNSKTEPTNEHTNASPTNTPTNPTLENNYKLLKAKVSQEEEDEPSQLELNGFDHEHTEDTNTSSLTSEKNDSDASNSNDAQNLLLQSLLKTEQSEKPEEMQPQIENTSATYSLKADAEEFIPRMLRSTETIHFDPNVQFVNLPPNVIPIPFVSDHPFLPPGIPINFIPPQDPKLITNFLNVIPNSPKIYNPPQSELPKTPETVEPTEEPKVDTKTSQQIRSEIDIAKIVSKLEEAAQQQQIETKKPYQKSPSRYSSAKSYSVQRTRYGSKSRQENQPYVDGQKGNPRRFRKPDQVYQRIQKPSKPDEVEQTKPKSDVPVDILRSQVVEPTKPQEPPAPVNRAVTPKRIYKDVCTQRSRMQQISPARLTNGYTNDAKQPAADGTRLKKQNVDAKAEPTTPKAIKTRNQWISVSNRKKRKNKVEEDNSACSENDELISDDQFESFDVNLLQDVIPPEKTVEAVEMLVEKPAEVETVVVVEDVPIEAAEKAIEVALSQVQLPDVPNKVANKTPKKKNEVKNKNKKVAASKAPTKKVMISDNLYLNNPPTPEITTSVDLPTKIEVSQFINNTADNDLQSPLEIIRDKDMPCEKESQKEVEPINELPATADEISKIPLEAAKVDLNLTPSVQLEEFIEPVEKKNKKKKKKQIKSPLIKQQSSSSSNATINNLDDSYDFLLETSTLEDFEQKTNLEISQELDRIIQKGIYSTLEEKIKSLQLNPLDDGFFKTLSYDVPETSSIIKPANFGKIPSTQLLKMPTANKSADKEKLIDIDFSKIKLPDLESQPSTSKSNIFVDVDNISNQLQELNSNFLSQEISTNGKSTNGKNLKNKSKKGSHMETPKSSDAVHHLNGKGENLLEIKKNLNTSSNIFRNQDGNDSNHLLTIKNSTIKQETLYPITQAVKEWMTKTRENTPDVEILKSPNTIYKELQISDIIKEKTPPRKHEEKQDDEITLWSVSPHESIEEDLLDCWENELTNGSSSTNEVDERCKKIVELKGSVQNGCSTITSAYIEEGEDVIEVYDSKYGTNEDFLKIQAEIEQKQYNDILNKIPKHGNLPYRAICCTIM